MAKPEFLITLPRRGLQIIPPPETQRNMAFARRLQQEKSGRGLPLEGIVWSDQERARIKLIKNHGPIKKRYPNPECGRKLMACVDYERREELLVWAKDLSDHIVAEWQSISSRDPVAVILYGSVARGTVKPPDHPNPSDIDLLVTGHFWESHRQALFSAIQEKREEISERILGHIDLTYAGVKIQSVRKLVVDGYNTTLNYIGSPVIPLHDSSSLWANLENSALNFFIRKNRGDPVMFNDVIYQRNSRLRRPWVIPAHHPCG